MASTLAELRTERDAALQATDCIYSPDLIKNYDEGAIATLDIYRQELRDVTNGVTDENVGDVVLPKPVDPNIAAFLQIDIS
tara:strand:- start:329 stop:571 length:243 start_codon:yes stop_codon:yes gene_type:complete